MEIKMDIVEDVKEVVQEVKAAVLPVVVELGDLKVLLDLQKETELMKELCKTKIELYEHKLVIVQMQIKAKYQMGDADSIDPKTAEIVRK